jgi:RNA polymerase sigma-70 factor (ECF subfamily)
MQEQQRLQQQQPIHDLTRLTRLTRLVSERAAGLALYARQFLDPADSSAGAAEDVVQEALAALLAERGAPDDPVAWMFRAVRNAAIDHARSAARRRRREREVAAMRGEWFQKSLDAPLDAQAAEAALRGLPAEAREIVVLRIWGEQGFAQIARIMGLGVSTVHERYTAALRQMRALLERQRPCVKAMKTASD